MMKNKKGYGHYAFFHNLINFGTCGKPLVSTNVYLNIGFMTIIIVEVDLKGIAI
jgi:hypothetical protein